MSFALKLNQLMQEKNITSYRLGKDMGISNRLIDYWKKGEKLPGFENIQKLALYFGVTTDYLLEHSPYRTISAQHLGANKREIVSRIKEAMKKMNLSPEDAAKKSGIPLAKLQSLLNGKEVDIAPIYLSSLADACGTSYGYLLFGPHQMQKQPTTVSDDGLDADIVRVTEKFNRLSPEDQKKVEEYMTLLSMKDRQ